jgi:hypothetical protein
MPTAADSPAVEWAKLLPPITIVHALGTVGADALRKQPAMSNQATEHSIQSIGKVQVETGGNLIKFELIGTLGQRIQCHAPYDKMQSILFALHAGMELATAEMAKRPGFQFQDYAPRLLPKRHVCSVVTDPRRKAHVCLTIDTKLDFSLSFMLPPEEAESMALALLRMAAQARRAPAPKPS